MLAHVLENLFTLDRKGGGPDDSFSLEPEELRQLCIDARTALSALGQVDYGRKSRSKPTLNLEGSYTATRTLQMGKVLLRTM